MRTLLFLPPPTLFSFNPKTKPITVHFNTHPRVGQDVTLEVKEQVHDSVEPILPDFNELEGEESVAKSLVEDAPLGVAWEDFHPHHLPYYRQQEDGRIVDETRIATQSGEEVRGRRRARKRVRIESPVLVIQTPERPFLLANGSVNGSGQQDVDQGEEDVSVDKSRVVVGDDSVDSISEKDSEGILIGLRSTVPAVEVGREGEGESSINVSESSLMVRVPIPASRPASTAIGGGGGGGGVAGQTCKFSFFSKRSSRLSTSVTIAPPTPTVHETQEQQQPPSPPPPAAAVQESHPVGMLPEMNDHNATLVYSLPSSSSQPSFGARSASLLGGQSILPPPTLHFTLSTITPVSRILAYPSHFLSFSTSGLLRPSSIPGAVSSRVNLLVVVKEVGEVMRVRSKFPVDKPPFGPTEKGLVLGRSEMRGRMSKAFTDALQNERLGMEAKIEDGKTERVELIVMDGRMSSIKRLLPSSPESPVGDWKVVEEAAEKCFFKVMVWGQLAREWTTDPSSPTPPQAHGSETSHTILKEQDSTALRPGDVVYLENLTLTRSPQTNAFDSPASTKRSRLGTGFPPPHPYAHGLQQEKLTLTAQANHANSSKIHLCYRTDVQDKLRDGRWNFDPDIAEFDLKSRRVLELSRVWTSSVQRRY